MAAEAEREVPVVAALWIELLRPLEVILVAVRRAQPREHDVAGREAVAVQLHRDARRDQSRPRPGLRRDAISSRGLSAIGPE